MTRDTMTLPASFLNVWEMWGAWRCAVSDALHSGEFDLAHHMAHMDPVDTDWLLPCPQRNPED